MKFRTFLPLAIALLAMPGCKRQQPTSPDQRAYDAKMDAAMKEFQAAFRTPIHFYGKIIDQHGDPVPDVTVEAEANDNPEPNERGTRRTLKSDAQGCFEIKGMQGLQLHVEVSKEGYYQLLERDSGKPLSYGGAKFHAVGGEKLHYTPDPAHPMLFALYKQGNTEPLVTMRDSPQSLPQDGTPVKLGLYTSGGEFTRYIIVRCWSDDKARDPQGHYDWRCEIEPVDADILPREGKFNFTAPADGYQPIAALSMPTSLPVNEWHESLDRSYFLAFKDGTFARIKVHLPSGKYGSTRITGLLNPKPGSRNLEYDPNSSY